MLEGLDAIDWGSLDHACGTAIDVPGLLRALASGEAGPRDDAFGELVGTLWREGTIYPASVAALPFLFDLLEVEGGHAAHAAFLAAAISGGHGAHPGDEGDDERGLVDALRRLAAPRLDLLLPHLGNADPRLRAAIARALARHPARASEMRPRLEATLASETDETVVAVLRESIAQLSTE